MKDQPYLLPVRNTISTAWQLTNGTKKSVWAAVVIVAFIIFVVGMISGFIVNRIPELDYPMRLITEIITFLLQTGVGYIGIRRVMNLPVSYRNVFRSFEWDVSWRILLTYLIQILIFIPPVILAFIAGLIYHPEITTTEIILSLSLVAVSIIILLYLSIRLALSMAFILDKKINPWSAIKLSFIATRGNVWRLIGLYCLLILILLVSLIPLGIGLIWSIPLMIMNYGVVYQRLSANIQNTQVVK